jgi:hypothetical protein
LIGDDVVPVIGHQPANDLQLTLQFRDIVDVLSTNIRPPLTTKSVAQTICSVRSLHRTGASGMARMFSTTLDRRAFLRHGPYNAESRMYS